MSDRDRYSLQTLLDARSLEEAASLQHDAFSPVPNDVWNARTAEFPEWPPLLSLAFPQLRLWDRRIMRLKEGCPVSGLSPRIGPGSWVLLKSLPAIPDVQSDTQKKGWSRPIYAFRKDMQTLFGHLEREENRYFLLSKMPEHELKAAIGSSDLTHLNLVAGVAVPL
jgi:hypothetical protein